MFAEAARVLRPGGVFCGSDNRGVGLRFQLIHLGDTKTVVPAETLGDRLTVVPWRQLFSDARLDREIHNQALAYAHAASNFGGAFRWMAFIDADEFQAKKADVAANAILDACTGSNPRQPSQEEMEKLLDCVYNDTPVTF